VRRAETRAKPAGPARVSHRPIIHPPAITHLAGPTASGKSAVALALAPRLDAEVVNADAFQLFRGLEFVTAAPTAADQRAVPHHLYGVLDPAGRCDAARYAAMARATLVSIAARGKRAIVVGGSGLYLKALTHGLSDLPSDESLRARLAGLSREEKLAKLLELDPAAAARVNLANPRYVDRALEICLLAGRPASELRVAWNGPDPAGLCGFLLVWPREELNLRIDRRAEAMASPAAVEAVARLGEVSATAGKAIGLNQLRELSSGRCTRAEAVASIQLATRRYAKRQMTWFRRERWLTAVPVAPGSTSDAIADSIADSILAAEPTGGGRGAG
jgi:tRNA dimethylallyltransferase